MNIPRGEDAGFLDFGTVDLAGPEFAAHFVTDLMVAGAYLLLLAVIVHLNRKKYISIYVPRKTYLIAFAVVFLLTSTASVVSVLVPASLVQIGYKLFVTGILVAVVLAVWRLFPRDVDPFEERRMAMENAALVEAVAKQRAAEKELADGKAMVESLVRERTSEFKAANTGLEKRLVEHKLAEERALESKRKLDDLILRTNTALVFTDGGGRVLDCNLALAQTLGRASVEELIGRDLGRLLGLRDDSELMHFLNETLRQGTFEAVIDAAPPARGVVAIEALGAATIQDGRPCVMAMFWDVTARSTADKELLQSREALTAALNVARKANATRSDFLAKMNHELRTPLNGIIGLSEIMRHKAESETFSGSEAFKLASNIHQSGRHLLSVVDDLLDLSRLDAGTRALSPTRVSVRAEIDTAVSTLASIAEKKRIKVSNRCDPGFEWTVDQRAFKQIIINLVNNAVKFSPPGSEVKIGVTHTTESMSLHIRDQGPGVASGDRERILEPFGRTEHAETQQVDGVGLGLTIVNELLKLQGGKIEIESELGKGATFIATFPVGARQDQEQSL
jgi:signal transduction histidine kinase